MFVDFTSNNVQLRNNILWVASGNLINIAPDSEAGFVSDYNSLITTGAGKLASGKAQVRDARRLVL